MGIARRTFLQRTGLALLILGGGEVGRSLWGANLASVPGLKRYIQTLAQPTPRKLALLVGINQYSVGKNLKGCVTDVERQRELLIHRFGFQPQDVLTLTDAAATREQIETAFMEHLVSQASADDVVVFHFSGYGSQAKRQLEAGETTLVNSLMPTDGGTAGKDAASVNNIDAETLALLAQSLATERVTLILDTSYHSTGHPLQGNLRVRTFPQTAIAPLSADELTWQAMLRDRLTSRQQLSKSQRPGAILAAAQDDQLATEAEWGGFSAGLFTYAFTQALWQALPASSLHVSLTQATQTLERYRGKQQQPKLAGKAGEKPLLFTYYSPLTASGAEGVIVSVDKDETISLRLTGLPIPVLGNYGVNSRFTLVPRASDSSIGQTAAQPPQQQEVRLKITSREGLSAKAKRVGEKSTTEPPLQAGCLVQEAIRVLPRNPGLVVALDAGLERIERVDATSAFASIAEVSSVITAGEGAADCLFGRVPDVQPNGSKLNGTLSEEGYGLFSVSGTPIPTTVGVKTEAVKSAVSRLAPKLKTLLAAKCWRLTVNEGSSRLGLRATLEMLAPQFKMLLQQVTLRSLSSQLPDSEALLNTCNTTPLPQVSIRSQIQYRLENFSDRPLYCLLLGTDSGGNAIALYSPQTTATNNFSTNTKELQDIAIAPGETRLLPEPATSFDWIIPGPAGLAEIYIIASIAPFSNTLAVLSETPHPKGQGERIVDLVDPLRVVQALQQDLQAASSIPAEVLGSEQSSYALDVNTWATLSFVYQVV